MFYSQTLTFALQIYPRRLEPTSDCYSMRVIKFKTLRLLAPKRPNRRRGGQTNKSDPLQFLTVHQKDVEDDDDDAGVDAIPRAVRHRVQSRKRGQLFRRSNHRQFVFLRKVSTALVGQ